MSNQVNVDFVTRQIEVDTDGKEHFISAAMAAKDAEQSMLNAQNAADEAETIKDRVEYLVNGNFPYVTPQMFGAVGNGVTPDQNAINSAIEYLSLQNGGILVFPAGVYYITDHIVVNHSNIKIIGVNGASIIKVGAWVDGIRVSDNAYPNTVNAIENIVIDGITIDGNRNGYVNGTNDTYGNGINLNSVRNCIVRNCTVKNVSEQGIVSTFWEQDGRQSCLIIESNEVIDCQAGRICIGIEGRAHDVKVINNTIICNSDSNEGINISYNSGEVELDAQTIVSNNNISSSSQKGVGIKIGNGITELILSNNFVTGFEASVRVSSDIGTSICDKIIIQGNYLKEFEKFGIALYPLVRNEDMQALVNNNMLISLNSNYDFGAIETTVKTTIQNNYINSKGYGINIKSSNCVVSNNTVYSNNYSIKTYEGYNLNSILYNITKSVTDIYDRDNSSVLGNIAFNNFVQVGTLRKTIEVVTGNYGECGLGGSIDTNEYRIINARVLDKANVSARIISSDENAARIQVLNLDNSYVANTTLNIEIMYTRKNT